MPPLKKGTTVASRTVRVLTDDTDGSEAQVTVNFGLDGTQYEIDLSEANAKKLLGALDPWMNAARRTRAPKGRRGSQTNSNADMKAVREWAKQQKLNVSDRGRVSAKVRQAYDQAVKG
jgi:nucleoid-associated protein Lsr2